MISVRIFFSFLFFLSVSPIHANQKILYRDALKTVSQKPISRSLFKQTLSQCGENKTTSAQQEMAFMQASSRTFAYLVYEHLMQSADKAADIKHTLHKSYHTALGELVKLGTYSDNPSEYINHVMRILCSVDKKNIPPTNETSPVVAMCRGCDLMDLQEQCMVSRWQTAQTVVSSCMKTGIKMGALLGAFGLSYYLKNCASARVAIPYQPDADLQADYYQVINNLREPCLNAGITQDEMAHAVASLDVDFLTDRVVAAVQKEELAVPQHSAESESFLNKLSNASEKYIPSAIRKHGVQACGVLASSLWILDTCARDILPTGVQEGVGLLGLGICLQKGMGLIDSVHKKMDSIDKTRDYFKSLGNIGVLAARITKSKTEHSFVQKKEQTRAFAYGTGSIGVAALGTYLMYRIIKSNINGAFDQVKSNLHELTVLFSHYPENIKSREMSSYDMGMATRILNNLYKNSGAVPAQSRDFFESYMRTLSLLDLTVGTKIKLLQSLHVAFTV